MKINIKVFPALNGDCFLVNYGNKNYKHVLIDCGYVSTYEHYLRKELQEISKKGEILERLIITHIDSDHIWGAIPFLKENAERYIEIKDVWHNSFRHLFDVNKEDETKRNTILERIISRGILKDEESRAKETISGEQGTTVGALLLKGGFSWNADFLHKAVCIDNRTYISLDEDAEIFLLSPDKVKLENLKKEWTDELKKYGVNFSENERHLYDDAFEMFLSWEKGIPKRKDKKISAVTKEIDDFLTEVADEDTKPTNGSSIAFIMEIGLKRLLFLADSHPSLILNSLNKYHSDNSIYFDFIKVAHHGSLHNISKQLLDKIDSENYLISTNGKRHNHPDIATIAQIVGRPSSFHRNIYFNYKTSQSSYFEKNDWMQKYNYSIHYIDNEPFTISL